eukprot:COSAG02_NODE_120_length_35326_cov_39.000823_12_plen_153_part_00
MRATPCDIFYPLHVFNRKCHKAARVLIATKAETRLLLSTVALSSPVLGGAAVLHSAPAHKSTLRRHSISAVKANAVTALAQSDVQKLQKAAMNKIAAFAAFARRFVPAAKNALERTGKVNVNSLLYYTMAHWGAFHEGTLQNLLNVRSINRL